MEYREVEAARARLVRARCISLFVSQSEEESPSALGLWMFRMEISPPFSPEAQESSLRLNSLRVETCHGALPVIATGTWQCCLHT